MGQYETGHRLPRDVVRRTILPFLEPPEDADLPIRCQYHTQSGDNCARAFRYRRAAAGELDDCSGYCAGQCVRWVRRMLAQPPTRVKDGPFELQVTRVEVARLPERPATYVPGTGWSRGGQSASVDDIARDLCGGAPREPVWISLWVDTQLDPRHTIDQYFRYGLRSARRPPIAFPDSDVWAGPIKHWTLQGSRSEGQPRWTADIALPAANA